MLMPKKVFDKLQLADVQLSWRLIGDEVLKRFTGEYVTPVPSFQTSKCPCGPGYVILSKFRSFKRWLRKEPPRRVFTECLWDFQPLSNNNSEQMIPVTTVCDRPASTFRFVASRTRKNKTKTIKITFHGKKITELDLHKHKLQKRRVATLLFDDTGFDSFSLHMVNKVFSIDRGRIEVWLDNDVDFVDILDQSPVGFKMCHLWLDETNEGDRFIDGISNVKSKNFKAAWLNRENYKQILRNFIPNQRKYGGEAGDIN
ncbi:uncharacterized protein LOC133173309 [Saccostrea echinata]|uniref:uncharacterized protein LOC133173309 n=1 Tax=Saccostrea echinata TaxID=191078 RepID=UPI002A7F987F|nr:uncharacterized protein LOC133173309 [Saccostrea echinata]